MSQRRNRPKVKGGFNPFDWYQQNKDKVTVLDSKGLRTVDPEEKPESENPAAPPQAAVQPRGRNLPPSAAVPGTGPKNNQVVCSIRLLFRCNGNCIRNNLKIAMRQ